MNDFKRLLKSLSKMEIEDHGFDFSVSIYQVWSLEKDCNDICMMNFIRKEDALEWIEENREEEKNYYWLKTLVWFSK